MNTTTHHTDADTLCDELDTLISRLTRADAHLYLDYDPGLSQGPYLVRDRANDNEAMIAWHTLVGAFAWASTFVEQTPGAYFDSGSLGTVISHSTRVPPALRLVK